MQLIIYNTCNTHIRRLYLISQLCICWRKTQIHVAIITTGIGMLSFQTSTHTKGRRYNSKQACAKYAGIISAIEHNFRIIGAIFRNNWPAQPRVVRINQKIAAAHAESLDQQQNNGDRVANVKINLRISKNLYHAHEELTDT